MYFCIYYMLVLFIIIMRNYVKNFKFYLTMQILMYFDQWQ